MKTTSINFCLIGFLLLFHAAKAQDTVRRTYSATTKSAFSINENTIIYNKETGKRMSYQEMDRILRENPRVNFTREIDERGEVAALYYDPTPSNGKLTRDISKRTKPGDRFPDFVFTTALDQEIKSMDLRGKVVVINFYLFLREPMVDKKSLADFENILKKYSKKSITAFLVTVSTKQETFQFGQENSVSYHLIPDAVNFHERYLITRYPTYVVVSKEGKLVGYTETLTGLEEMLQ